MRIREINQIAQCFLFPYGNLLLQWENEECISHHNRIFKYNNVERRSRGRKKRIRILFIYMNSCCYFSHIWHILLIKLYCHLCGKLNPTHNRKHIWSLWNDLTHVWPNKDNMDRTGLNRDDIGFRLEILLNI